MAAWQKTQNTCFGRGFDAGGFMGRLIAFMVLAYGSGGPGWYLIDDQSGAGTPYVVFCSLNNPGANITAIYMKVGYGPAGQIYVRFYGWWNTTTHVGYGYWGGYTLTTQDQDNFIYDFRGGPEGIILQSNFGLTWYSAFIDTWTGLSNRVEATTKRGVFATGNHDGDSDNKIQGMQNVSGIVLGTNTDANNWIHMSVVDMGSGNYRINLYKDLARTQLVAHTSNFAASNTTLQGLGLTQDNSSGIGGSLQYQGPGVLTTTPAHRFGQTFTVNAGHDLTTDEYYYITDYQNKTTVFFVKLTAKSGNELTFDRTLAQGNFGPGAVVAAYEHRFALGGNQSTLMIWRFQLPYMSRVGFESIPHATEASLDSSLVNNQTCPSGYMEALSRTLEREAPNHKNKYGVHRALVGEMRSYQNSNANHGRRSYGVMNNIFMTFNNGMSRSNNGRTIGSLNYLYFISGSEADNLGGPGVALLYRDTTSLS